ncbi:MAG TPA: hypothetical protein VHN14_29620 [Kofleriaceae bacterium]|jgi:hypothetical protein|nr:hypothetical protein [Kofleriaceae bacterium]
MESIENIRCSAMRDDNEVMLSLCQALDATSPCGTWSLHPDVTRGARADCPKGFASFAPPTPRIEAAWLTSYVVGRR